MYEPLATADAFRLLVLEPGEKSEEIHCRILTTTHSAHLDYEALSYTWGSTKHPQACYINDDRVAIGRNLWDALRHLRSTYAERVLWIDALCIDQSNILERNHQVGQMRMIYSQAETVLIWLGMPSPSSPIAMDWLDRSASRFRSSFGTLGRLTSRTPADVFLQQAHRWAALRLLCERPYWHRVWIVQEAVLAENIRLLCGEDEARWEGFANLMNDFGTILQPSSAIEDAGFVQGSMAARILDLRRMHRSRGCDLMQLLIATRDSLCADPRDRVFGLVGLAEDLQSHDIDIDYSGKNGHHDMLRNLWGFFVDSNDRFTRMQGCQFLGTQFLQNNIKSEEMKWVLSQGQELKTTYDIIGKPVGTVIYTGQPWNGGSDVQLWQETLQHVLERFTGPRVVAQYEELRAALRIVARDNDGLRLGTLPRKGRTKRSRPGHPSANRIPTQSLGQSKTMPVSENAVLKERGTQFAFWENTDFCLPFMENFSVFVSSKGQMGIAGVGISVGDELCQFQNCDVTALFRRRGKPEVAPMAEGIDLSSEREHRFRFEWPKASIVGKAILAKRPDESQGGWVERSKRSTIPIVAKYSVLDERLILKSRPRFRSWRVTDRRTVVTEVEDADSLIQFALSGKRLRWLSSWPRVLDSPASAPYATAQQGD